MTYGYIVSGLCCVATGLWMLTQEPGLDPLILMVLGQILLWIGFDERAK